MIFIATEINYFTNVSSYKLSYISLQVTAELFLKIAKKYYPFQLCTIYFEKPVWSQNID